ncbi:hypothetical protein QZH41_000236 [Actinostola sp. cb2023]|nr:hypothetical protein QZH41_000236 [Actinostola sp. cb2023]
MSGKQPESKGKQAKKRTRASSSEEMADQNAQGINVRFDHIEEMLHDYFAKLNTEITSVKSELIQMVKDLKKDLMEVIKSIENVWAEVEEAKDAAQTTRTKLDEACKENEELKSKIAQMEKRTTHLEDYSRRENIRVYNVPENEKEDCLDIARELLQAVGKDSSEVMIHAAHRTRGPAFGSRPRPMLIRFVIAKTGTLYGRTNGG